MITKKEEEIAFKVMGSPLYWRKKAEELKFASEVLWPETKKRLDKIFQSLKEKNDVDFGSLSPDTFSIYLSLIGFSTECLFKGVAIRDNPSYMNDGRMSKDLTHGKKSKNLIRGNGHDLLSLSLLANIHLSNHEEIFCKQAYNAMVIDSRYPIPKNIEQYPNQTTPIGGNCRDVFIGLYDRLYPTLGQLNLRDGQKHIADKK